MCRTSTLRDSLTREGSCTLSTGIEGKHHHNQRPRNVLRKRDLYRAKTIDASQEFELEFLLARGENKWSQMVSTITREGVVSSDSIPDLVEYLAFQIVRTLQQRESARSFSDYLSTGVAILELRAQQESGELSSSESAAVDEFVVDANKGELRATRPESHLLGDQMAGLVPIVEILERRLALRGGVSRPSGFRSFRPPPCTLG